MPDNNAPTSTAAGSPATGQPATGTRDDDPGRVPATGTTPAATDGGDDDDDIESITDVERLRERIRQQRRGERRLLRELAAARTSPGGDQQPAPQDDRSRQEVEDLRRQLREQKERADRVEKEREQERVDAAIAKAAKDLGAIDPEAVARFVDPDDLDFEDGKVKPKSVENAVKAVLRQKSYLVGSGRGSADGGTGGRSGGAKPDMNAILRASRRGGRVNLLEE